MTTPPGQFKQVKPIPEDWFPTETWDGTPETKHNGEYVTAIQSHAEKAYHQFFDVRQLTSAWQQNSNAPRGEIWWEPTHPEYHPDEHLYSDAYHGMSHYAILNTMSCMELLPSEDRVKSHRMLQVDST